MKILSWNCNGAFRKKYDALNDLNVDLIVVQECENPAQSTNCYREWAGEYLWHGESKHKGIGIFPRNGVKVERLLWSDFGLQLFLPCRVDSQFNLLAVWTKHAGSPNFRYIGQLWKYIQQNRECLSQDKLILCGDLNSNTCWDEWDRWWNHSDVVRELAELDLHSVYHRHFGEKQGRESRPTLLHQRNIEKPYHVDYAFAPESFFQTGKDKVEIGDSADWLRLSDHMPLLFSVHTD